MAEDFGLPEVRLALAEDRAQNDVTTQLLGARTEQPATAQFIAEERFVVAGLHVARLVFQELDPAAVVECHVADGDVVEPGALLLTVRSTARTLLAGERVALNFLQRLSGVATLTRQAVDSIAGTQARITHTRKTTPGLRALECHAVRAGGGVDNRTSLADAILWKDNHWEMLADNGGSLAECLTRATPGLPVIVEVETEAQLETALAAGVTHLLIDNQPPARFAEWVTRAKPGVTIQASGGITLSNAADYANAGADLIAMGALTHSAPAVSIRVDSRSLAADAHT